MYLTNKHFKLKKKNKLTDWLRIEIQIRTENQYDNTTAMIRINIKLEHEKAIRARIEKHGIITLNFELAYTFCEYTRPR